MNSIYSTEDIIECGVDEAGRGPIFGRLYAGACIWKKDLKDSRIKDSKKYTDIKKREEAYNFVIENSISWGVSYVEPYDLDKDGMTNSLMKVMHRAIENTYIFPEHILVDGNYFKPLLNDYDRGKYSYTTIIGGDNSYYSIAGASIIAKVEHDRYIDELCEKYPILKEYDIHNNKGYGTSKHLDAIKSLGGITNLHRKSFKCNSDYPVIFNL